MLTGKAPFIGNNTEETAEAIFKGIGHNKKKWLKDVSIEAKDLVLKMLDLDPSTRVTAQEALEHEWIQNHVNGTIEDNPISQSALSRLGNFRVSFIQASTKLQKSFLVFITSQIFGENEERELAKLFKELDINGDGKLSHDELKIGYQRLNLASQSQIKEIIKECDSDGSGYIDFTEFITAATNWRQVLQKEQLKSAFNLYGGSEEGLLSLKTLKAAIPGIEESEWIQFLNEADSNGDGMISLNELKKYLSDTIFN